MQWRDIFDMWKEVAIVVIGVVLPLFLGVACGVGLIYVCLTHL